MNIDILNANGGPGLGLGHTRLRVGHGDITKLRVMDAFPRGGVLPRSRGGTRTWSSALRVVLLKFSVSAFERQVEREVSDNHSTPVYGSRHPVHRSKSENARRRPFQPQLVCDYPLDLSISLRGGKETKKDSLSSCERSGKSPALNPLGLCAHWEM